MGVGGRLMRLGACCGAGLLGLGGGLLVGHLKKLDKDLTEDLAFSMKAICGALVLSLGVDGMWRVMSSLFIEVMLLSPKENQRYAEESRRCALIAPPGITPL